jgi:hypothetical protein
MSYFIGITPSDINQSFIKRYLYGLRRNEDGELFFISIDQLGTDDDEIVINEIGTGDDNYPFFEEGIDFLEGITIDHEIEYPNLRYPQLKWDNRFLSYYIDINGRLSIKINRNHVYEEGISTEGY